MEGVLENIRRGDFAQEWADEYADGYPRLEALRRAWENMPVWQDEQATLAALKRGDSG